MYYFPFICHLAFSGSILIRIVNLVKKERMKYRYVIFFIFVFILRTESSARLKEERTVTDMDDKSSAPEATSTSYPNKLPGPNEKVLRTVTVVEGLSPRISKRGRYSDIDVENVREAEEQPESPSNSMKKRRKPILTKKVIIKAPVGLL